MHALCLFVFIFWKYYTKVLLCLSLYIKHKTCLWMNDKVIFHRFYVFHREMYFVFFSSRKTEELRQGWKKAGANLHVCVNSTAWGDCTWPEHCNHGYRMGSGQDNKCCSYGVNDVFEELLLKNRWKLCCEFVFLWHIDVSELIYIIIVSFAWYIVTRE